MGEVAAHAPALVEHVERRLGGVRVLVTEGDVGVDKIADRLHPPPAARGIAKQRPGGFREQVGLAIPAAEQKQQRLGRQIGDRGLAGRGDEGIALTAVVHDRLGR